MKENTTEECSCRSCTRKDLDHFEKKNWPGSNPGKFWMDTSSPHLKSLLERAEAGDAVIQGQFARELLAARKYDEFIFWARKAAAQGDGLGMYLMGEALYHSYGIEHDDFKAFQWYRAAANKGIALAQMKVGFCYQFALGAPEDPDKAAKWLRKARQKPDVLVVLNQISRLGNLSPAEMMEMPHYRPPEDDNDDEDEVDDDDPTNKRNNTVIEMDESSTTDETLSQRSISKGSEDCDVEIRSDSFKLPPKSSLRKCFSDPPGQNPEILRVPTDRELRPMIDDDEDVLCHVCGGRSAMNCARCDSVAYCSVAWSALRNLSVFIYLFCFVLFFYNLF
jgi:hypothetical protein